ncbi:MAG TPA: response regulator [Candidatus Didemnitutus sp.]|nr:response regulator [Candidatus Didemnitutus sp.]
MADTPTRRPVILLLEDEVELSGTISENLSKDFEVETATSAEDAMLLLASREYDALVCDHMLPGPMQGLDFLMEAVKRQPAARRLLITGYMNPELLSRSVIAAGLSDCLMKPVSVERLRQALWEAGVKPA